MIESAEVSSNQTLPTRYTFLTLLIVWLFATVYCSTNSVLHRQLNWQAQRCFQQPSVKYVCVAGRSTMLEPSRDTEKRV